MIDKIEATLNRLVAFSSETSSLDDAVELRNIATALEAADDIPVLTETCMSLCVDLVENSPPHAATVRSVLTLLARCCMREENRRLAARFGVFGLCVLVLRDHNSLSTDTLFATFDLIGTLAMNDGNSRRMMRPSIPYVVEVMEKHADSLQLAFGGAVVIGTLTMLDNANAVLAAEHGCIQLLISSFVQAHKRKKQLLCHRTSNLSRSKRDDEVLLCDNVIRWTRDALLKLVQAPAPIIDEKLGAADFGSYGASVEVDELTWQLRFDRRRVKASTP
ncbi:hypothetical protein DQ04_03601040 [Trypanosoma grayi]|uniref:hypothetical protein n=1 Tax=Trypanosoma grayi TaxID=71804 RepID=UPI0004F48F6E|nr:hypothetical protein DQ04_03601040 [Trypanosoma grayi]KEG10539.1 hypothetical protein DQ04_03601040 [Trypanosoma grayi]